MDTSACIEVTSEDNNKFTRIHVLDETDDGCGAKFVIQLVSDELFKGVSLLKRHKLVHGFLGTYMDEIHALTLKTLTRAQYTKSLAK